jgi:hypothetical protein
MDAANSDNRRRFRRLSVRIPGNVQLRSRPGQDFDAEILDISEGGAFVHCMAPILIGDEVLIEISFRETKILEAKVIDWDEWVLKNLPADNPERSVVRWARGSSQSGFGVEFLDLKADKKQFLVRLMDYFEQLTKAGVSFKS